jgi:hypothetical protein
MNRLHVIVIAVSLSACTSVDVPAGDDPQRGALCEVIEDLAGCAPSPPGPMPIDDGGDFELLTPHGDPIPLADGGERMVFPWSEFGWDTPYGSGFSLRVRSQLHRPGLWTCTFYDAYVHVNGRTTGTTRMVDGYEAEAVPFNVPINDIEVPPEGLDVDLEVIQWDTDGGAGHRRTVKLRLVDPCGVSGP